MASIKMQPLVIDMGGTDGPRKITDYPARESLRNALSIRIKNSANFDGVFIRILGDAENFVNESHSGEKLIFARNPCFSQNNATLESSEFVVIELTEDGADYLIYINEV